MPAKNVPMPEGDTVEEADGADRLVEAGPGNAGRDQLDLIGVYLGQTKPFRRTPEILVERRQVIARRYKPTPKTAGSS